MNKRPRIRRFSGRRYLKRILLSIGTVLLVLGGWELALRVAGFRYKALDVPIILRSSKRDRMMLSGTDLHIHDLHQLWIPRPLAVYEGAPDKDAVNKAGYRGPLLTRRKRPGVLRIATLGDSSTFGCRVNYCDTFSSSLVDEMGGEDSCEVLCGGVIGYSVRQGLERYRRLVRRYRPDIVITAFGSINDHYIGSGFTDEEKMQRNLERKSPAYRNFRKLQDSVRLLQFLIYLRDSIRGTAYTCMEDVIADQERKKKWRRENRANASQADWAGPRRVSPEEFKGVYLRLIEEIEKDGALPILISMPRRVSAEETLPILCRYTEIVNEIALEERVGMLNAHALFRDLVESDNSAEKELMIDRYHPTPLGHRIIAEELGKIIQRRLPAR